MKKLIFLLFIGNGFSYALESQLMTNDVEIYDLLHSGQSAASDPFKKRVISSSSVINKPSIISNSHVEHVSNKSPVIEVKSSNLDSIDNMSNDILYKKRQLEQEKLNAEIKKARMGEQTSFSSQAQMNIKETAQTVVIGVAIDSDGRKIAWLQFADGGSLSVNIGSQVGEYQVSNITMSNVILTKKIGNKVKNIILKRSYVAMDKNNNRIFNNAVFNPSPVLTGANISDVNKSVEIVPPIIK